jgi:GT2 family glycosyltransferase
MALVSVLTPMRNAEPFIRAALTSILAQEGVELEVVAIDDGSTDHSAAVVQEVGDPRVRLLPGPCRGISAALNAALAAARGDYVARCDADDLYPPGRLAGQVGWLEEHPEFGAICGRFSTLTPHGGPVADLGSAGAAEEITGELRRGVVRTHLCTFTVRTSLLRQVGGYRPYFVTGEDLDLQLRLGEAGRVWYVPLSCYSYRLHDLSVTHREGKTRQAFFEEVARCFQTQRLAGAPDDLERGCPPSSPRVWDAPDQPAAEVQGILLGQAWEEHAAGRKLRAMRTGLRACLARPSSLESWKSLAALALKPRQPRRGCVSEPRVAQRTREDYQAFRSTSSQACPTAS